MSAYQLTLQAGPTPGKIYPLQKDEISIGRELANDIIISDADVSRRHARLVRQGEGYLLEDLSSTNGTFINGQHLAGPRLLQPTDLITLGESVVLIYEAAALEGEPARLEQQPEVIAPALVIVDQPAEVLPMPVLDEFPRGIPAPEQFPRPEPVIAVPQPPLSSAEPGSQAAGGREPVKQAASQGLPVVEKPAAEKAQPVRATPAKTNPNRNLFIALAIGAGFLLLLCVCVVVVLIAGLVTIV